MAIQLKIDRVLQGTFDLKALNLLFVFQVNCPGCFIYGFPLVNKLYWKYRQLGLNILGLSTAFEDFEYNTAANTALLLTEMKLVGATRQALGEFYSQTIDFPVAVDRATTGAALVTPENIEALTETIPDFDHLPKSEQTALRQKVNAYLQRHAKTSATFTLNHLPGTPSFLLVDQNLQLLDGWFGHTPEAVVIERIEKHLRIVKEVTQKLCE
ncbi:MAG: hypothetical protein CLLPBCKN_006254 [Chroococcidiopsis cubana SAG 39.79]|uniref:Uncharacterized protein n=1 Tax=Chroococcidiopsis cubana SAG 39.79 TaxID=388085 RepID=A0AB37UAH3_9CYAN|nr:hypothetical protein [Chroococcidiopsis cubana]MDZ4876819.1 hypothetical protein [Chroococcidiopsis cubana SAG 39.79]RUT01990.1 hypothetical protein DSM107010_63680 [Chroococcidiopsis cubana SAG 39.79]